MTKINFANIFTNVMLLGIFIVIVILATMIVVRNFQPEREREEGPPRAVLPWSASCAACELLFSHSCLSPLLCCIHCTVLCSALFADCLVSCICLSPLLCSALQTALLCHYSAGLCLVTCACELLVPLSSALICSSTCALLNWIVACTCELVAITCISPLLEDYLSSISLLICCLCFL